MIVEYFTNLGCFFKDSYKFLRLLRYLSKHDLKNLSNEEMLILKQIVMDNGALSIKFMQWYLSNKETDNFDGSYEKIIEYFDDVFDNCPYHSLEETKEIFKSEFNTEMSEIIDINSIEHIGSGSIGQVYKCKINDKYVAMKVKHPSVNKIIRNQRYIIDLIIFIQKIEYLKNYFELYYDINDFMETLYLQLDFKNEVFNTNKFYKIFSDNPLVVIPKILYSSNSIIISEYENGINYDELSKYQKLKAGIIFYCLILQMVLFSNFIHGDLHKKNWKVRLNKNKDYQIIVYDFGLCFSTDNIEINKSIWEGFEENNVDKLIKYFNHFIISDKENYDINQDKDFIDKSLREIWSSAFSAKTLLSKLNTILKTRNIFLNKTITNIIILLILVQKTFVESDFCRIEKEARFDEMRKNIDKFNDILAFIKKYEFYNHITKYVENKIEFFKKKEDGELEVEKYLELDDPLSF